MEESQPPPPTGRKKIRLSRAEAHALGLAAPRKKGIAFGSVSLLLAVALGGVLWHFRDFWLPYWQAKTNPPPPAAPAMSGTEPLVAAESADAPKPPPPPVALPHPESLDFLSAAVWDHPPFLQGVAAYNEALDRYRRFLTDRANLAPLLQAEESALQAGRIFAAIQADAPATVPVTEYAARCQSLLVEIRRLGQASSRSASSAGGGAAAPESQVASPPASGATWPAPDYLEGAKLFNQALEQYRLFLADKTRTELLKPIEEAAFQAAKKFEALKGLAPAGVPLNENIAQCYKLISDCRRQNLERAGSGTESGKSGRGTVGPHRRPALPPYQPPP